MVDEERSFGEKATLAAVDITAAIFADIVTDARRRVVEQGWFGAPQDGPAGQGSKLAELGQAPTGEDVDPFDPWGWTKEAAPKEPSAEQQLEHAKLLSAMDVPGSGEPPRGIDL